MAIIEEVTNEENTKEEVKEKKENAFSKFLKKTKQSVSDSVLEVKLESKFNSENKEATVYTVGNLFSDNVYGYFDNDDFVCLGEHEFKQNSVLVVEEKPYYIDSANEDVVEIVYDGFSYERKATRYHLDSNVTEVNVIKAGKHYYLVKE